MIRVSVVIAGVMLAALPAAAGETGRPRCTRDYAPVCAKGEGGVRTWNNRDCARHYGAKVIHVGVCGSQIEPRQQNSAGFGECQPVVKPVCAEKNGEKLTYPNVCIAGQAGASYLYTGECWAWHP